MAESCPSRTVLGVNSDKLDIVLDGCLVLSIGGAVLSKLIDSVNVDQVVTISSHKVVVNTGVCDGHSLVLDILVCLRLL